MISSGVQFLRPVSVDELRLDHFESLDQVEGINQSGLVLLKVDSTPSQTQTSTMPPPEPKPSPYELAIEALKVAENAVEKLGLDYDSMWLVSLLQPLPAKKRIFSSAAVPKAPTSTMSLQDLGNLAKEREILIATPDNFDENAYLLDNPDVAAEIGNEGFGSGYEHYVLYGHLEGRKRPVVSG